MCVGKYAALIVGALAAGAPPALAQEDAQILTTGAKIYDVNCAPCHGDKLANPGITFDLKRLKSGDKARFQNSVLNGKSQMPPWKGVLKDSELDAIWAYIRANANERE